MEARLIDAAERAGLFVYSETVADEDCIDSDKLMAVRGMLAG